METTQVPISANGLDDVVYTHNEILFSLENEGNPDTVTTWMDLEGILLSKISQRNKNSALNKIYVESKRADLRNRA